VLANSRQQPCNVTGRQKITLIPTIWQAKSLLMPRALLGCTAMPCQGMVLQRNTISGISVGLAAVVEGAQLR